ncbi:MAG: MFS transporter [Myxococcota bacterium]
MPESPPSAIGPVRSDPTPSSTPSPTSERVPLSVMLAYGAPSFAGAAMAVPIYVHMPKFYADVVLVPLGYLALAIAFARALDALTDPLMGWVSDRTRTRWGRRKPWMAVGVPLCALAFLGLFSPPASLDPFEAATWFGTFFVLYFLFHTVYEIPHYGLGAEISLDYHERSRLFGVRALFLVPGTFLAVILPSVLGEMGATPREQFTAVAVIYGALLIALYAILLARVPERREFVNRESNPLIPGVRRALRNRPFRLLLTIYVIGSIPGAIPGTLMPFYSTYVLQPENPERFLMYCLAAYFGSGFLFLPFWIWIARRFSKLAAWFSCFIIGISGGAALFFLGPGDEPLAVGLLFYTGIQFGGGFFIGSSMQADVIDYDELHTGRRREAQYGAFWSMVPKFVIIPSAAIPLAILSIMGYVPNQAQNPQVVMTIRAIFALTPAFFSLLALLVALRYPLSEAVHQAIRRGIEQHGRGEEAVDPLTGAVIPVPHQGLVDDSTGWFLDHFSPAQLRRALARGPEALFPGVLRAVAISVMALAGSVYFVAREASDLSTNPGVLASVGVVGFGCALTALLYHLAKIAPALRARRSPIKPDDIRNHLGEAHELGEIASRDEPLQEVAAK